MHDLCVENRRNIYLEFRFTLTTLVFHRIRFNGNGFSISARYAPASEGPGFYFGSNSPGSTPRASASKTIVVRVGLLFPFSMARMVP